MRIKQDELERFAARLRAEERSPATIEKYCRDQFLPSGLRPNNVRPYTLPAKRHSRRSSRASASRSALPPGDRPRRMHASSRASRRAA